MVLLLFFQVRTLGKFSPGFFVTRLKYILRASVANSLSKLGAVNLYLNAGTTRLYRNKAQRRSGKVILRIFGCFAEHVASRTRLLLVRGNTVLSWHFPKKVFRAFVDEIKRLFIRKNTFINTV